MQTTENLGLNLPEYGEFAEVEKLNENFEKIDSKVGEIKNNLNGISLSVEDGILTATYDDGKE